VIQGIVHRPHIGQVSLKVKIRRGIEAADKVPAEIGPIVIYNDRFHIVHIEAQCITEQQDQNQRNGKSQVKAPEIPDQVEDLFAEYGLKPARIQELPLVIKATKASWRSAPGLSGQAAATICSGLPCATIRPSLIITIRWQLYASSM